MDLFEAQSKPASADRSEVDPEKGEEEGALDFSLKGFITGNDYTTTTDGGIRSLPMPMPAASQLTILFGGTVTVYDAVSLEKAQAIMLIAAAMGVAARTSANNSLANIATTPAPVAAGPAAAPTVAAEPAAPVLTSTLSLLSSSAATDGVLGQPELAPNSSNSLCKLQAELPIARRHSFQRFLEKRHDRVVSKAPYASAKTSDSAEVASEAQQQQQLM